MKSSRILWTLAISVGLLALSGCRPAVQPTDSPPTATTEPTIQVPAESATPEPTAQPPAETATPEPGPSEEPVDGWTGVIVQLPAGNQFGQYFEREDGQRYDIGGANEGARQLIAQFRGTGTVVKVWGTLFTGVPASEARHIEADRIEGQPQGEPVDGWRGTIIQLPPGNQFGQYFERDDGEQFGIGGTTDALRQQISELRGTGTSIQVWGTLYTGVPATEARQIEVTRIEIVSEPGTETAESWTGTIVKLPPGNQFGQYFLRTDGEKYGIDGASDAVRQQISELRWTGAEIKVWGAVEYGVPASEARHITADRIEAVTGPSAEPRNLSVFASATASSTLSSDRGGTYFAAAAIDGALETAWVESVSGPGIGESVTLTFPEPILVQRIRVDVGFDKDETLFYANNRIKSATLKFSDGSQMRASFSDTRGLQEIILAQGSQPLVETSSVQLTIDEVYAGSKYDDTCLAELEVWGITK